MGLGVRFLYITIFMTIWLGSQYSLLAEEYPYTYRSAAFLGRGDTGIADADNEDAIFYNPGFLGFGDSIYKKIVFPSFGIQLSNSIADLYKKVSLQEEEPSSALRSLIGNPQHMGSNFFSGIVLRGFGLGLYGTMTSDALVAKDPEEGALEMASASFRGRGGLTFSLAQSFSGNQSIGVTTRVMTALNGSAEVKATDPSDIQYVRGQGSAIDVGYVYKHVGSENINLGITIENLFDTKFESVDPNSSSKPDPDPMTFNLGFAFIKASHLSNFKILFDYRDLFGKTGHSALKRTHLGFELAFSSWLGLLTGLNQGYLTFGAYGDLRLFRFDFGLYTEEMGTKVGERGDRRIYFRIGTGF